MTVIKFNVAIWLKQTDAHLSNIRKFGTHLAKQFLINLPQRKTAVQHNKVIQASWKKTTKAGTKTNQKYQPKFQLNQNQLNQQSAALKM